MKKCIPFFIALFTLIASLQAQKNPELEKYEMGRGLRFETKTGATYRISGYLQPYAERKQLLKSDAPADIRFRMRRIRLRLDGTAANPKFSYRLQADLSGT